MNELKFEKEVEGLYKIHLGCALIGHISILGDFYEVSVCYHEFTINKRYKRFLRKMILETYKTKFYLLEAERKNVPLRISRNLKPIPKGIERKEMQSL